MNAEPQLVGAVGDLEERLGGPRKSGAGEGDAEGACQVIGAPGQGLDLIEIVSARGCRAGDLGDDEVASDATALAVLVRLAGGDVVGDGDDASVDPFLSQCPSALAELKAVAGVVAEEQERAGAVVCRSCHGDDL